MCATQIIIGAVMQALGFFAVLLDMHLIRSNEGRAIAFLDALKDRLTSPPRHTEPADLRTLSAHGTSSASMDLTAPTQLKQPEPTMEEQIRKLASKLDDVQKETHEAATTARQAKDAAREAREAARVQIESTKRDIESQIEQQECDDNEVKNRSDLLQGVALLLFVIGLTLTTVGSV
jgi:type IV secretory pathway VirB10-like protein